MAPEFQKTIKRADYVSATVNDNPDIFLLAGRNAISERFEFGLKSIDLFRFRPCVINDALFVWQVNAASLGRLAGFAAVGGPRFFGIGAMGGDKPIGNILTPSLAQEFHDCLVVTRERGRFAILKFKRTGDNLGPNFGSPVLQSATGTIYVT